jgi:hypothetical protein
MDSRSAFQADGSWSAFGNGGIGPFSPIRRAVSHRLQSADSGHWLDGPSVAEVG